jgi:rRNA maturation endonuclease Nob1
MPDFFAIEWQQFSVNCPGCKSLVTQTLGHAQRNPKTICGNCGATVDLETPEAKDRQSEAAIAAMERAVKDAP